MSTDVFQEPRAGNMKFTILGFDIEMAILEPREGCSHVLNLGTRVDRYIVNVCVDTVVEYIPENFIHK